MLKKNDSNHAAFQVNREEILEDDLQQVSGGCANCYYEICPYCQKVINQTLIEHKPDCTVKPWEAIYSRG